MDIYSKQVSFTPSKWVFFASIRRIEDLSSFCSYIFPILCLFGENKSFDILIVIEKRREVAQYSITFNPLIWTSANFLYLNSHC